MVGFVLVIVSLLLMEPVSLEPIIKGRRLGFECSLSDTTKFIAVIHEDFTGSQNRNPCV